MLGGWCSVTDLTITAIIGTTTRTARVAIITRLFGAFCPLIVSETRDVGVFEAVSLAVLVAFPLPAPATVAGAALSSPPAAEPAGEASCAAPSWSACAGMACAVFDVNSEVAAGWADFAALSA